MTPEMTPECECSDRITVGVDFWCSTCKYGKCKYCAANCADKKHDVRTLSRRKFKTKEALWRAIAKAR